MKRDNTPWGPTPPADINWADGGTFDIEQASELELAARARFERLAEIHQEKGNSECLPKDRNEKGIEKLISRAEKYNQ